MNRPLWQIFLHVAMLSFVVHRAAIAVVFYLSDTPTPLWLSFAFQGVAGLVTSVGIWMGRMWVLVPLVITGLSVIASALIGAIAYGAIPPGAAMAQVILAILATAGLAFALRHELGENAGS